MIIVLNAVFSALVITDTITALTWPEGTIHKKFLTLCAVINVAIWWAILA